MPVPAHSTPLPVGPAPRRATSPFGPTASAVAAALAFALVAAVWVVAGRDWVPGRWVPLHLFTLGVLTNLVLGFSEHFGRTLTRQPDTPLRWQVPATQVGVAAVLLALPTGTPWLLAGGATLVTGVVVASWWRLRRMRHAAIGARFTWVVRVYERAHGAFVHGAMLGVLMGTGVVTGRWYASARLAHLHVNVLGWGGLTLLGTLVFFGPTLARTRIEEGADARAARALRLGATALTVAVLALLGSGAGGGIGTVLRVLAAVGLAGYAWATTVVCVPVARSAVHGNDPAARWPLVAVATWFILATWADVVVVATGAWTHLDTIGVVVLLGVLLQAMAAALGHVAPMLRGQGATDRERLRERLARAAAPRAAVAALGVAAVAAAVEVTGPVGAWLVRAGWAAVLGAMLHHAAAGLWPRHGRRG